MEQATTLAQLSRVELYAIYQFLLLESRSPQEIHRNAAKEQMIGILSRTLTVEESSYCSDFFEHYEFYEVPVLKWEMIDALPDDLLCALHSIYLDSLDFPETHEGLVDSLSQSNYFLKEDARKFYLWFHYFRERIRWEDTAAAKEPLYDESTVRYDLEDMGVAGSFTMENYGEILAEDAGLPDHLKTVEFSPDEHMQHISEPSPTPEEAYDASTSNVEQPHHTLPSQPGLAAVESQAPAEDLKKTTIDAQLTPLQEKLLASLEQEGQTRNRAANQTIEINSFNLESYMLEQEEAARAEAALRAQANAAAPATNGTTQVDDPVIVDEGPSVIVEDPSYVVDAPLVGQDVHNGAVHEPSKPPPPPPQPPPPPKNPRQTMILDATAIVEDTIQGGKKPSVPPVEPVVDDPDVVDLSAEDIDLEESVDILSPLDVEEDIVEPVQEATPPPKRTSKPPPPKPPPRRSKKRSTPPRPPVRTAGSLDFSQIEILVTILYRSALLGATYGRPQIRAIRIFIQKIMDGGPEQLRQVRDILKRLQTEDHPLVPPAVHVLADLVSIIPYAARLHLVHTTIFLLGCKTLTHLERYRDFLIDMAVELRLDPADVSLFDLFGIRDAEIQLDVKDCLELFGLEEDASEGQIRKAHRAQVRRYHPDQFHSHGSEFVRLAERKMKECNMALDILLRRADRGF